MDLIGGGGTAGWAFFLYLFTGTVLVQFLIVAGVACYLLSDALKQLPADSRQIPPGLVWFLMLPLVATILNFFILPPVAQSFKNYFRRKDNQTVGDCGEALAWGYAVCGLLPVLSLVGLPIFAGFALLDFALLLLFVIKIRECAAKAKALQAQSIFP